MKLTSDFTWFKDLAVPTKQVKRIKNQLSVSIISNRNWDKTNRERITRKAHLEKSMELVMQLDVINKIHLQF